MTLYERSWSSISVYSGLNLITFVCICLLCFIHVCILIISLRHKTQCDKINVKSFKDSIPIYTEKCSIIIGYYKIKKKYRLLTDICLSKAIWDARSVWLSESVDWWIAATGSMVSQLLIFVAVCLFVWHDGYYIQYKLSVKTTYKGYWSKGRQLIGCKKQYNFPTYSITAYTLS